MKKIAAIFVFTAVLGLSTPKAMALNNLEPDFNSCWHECQDSTRFGSDNCWMQCQMRPNHQRLYFNPGYSGPFYPGPAYYYYEYPGFNFGYGPYYEGVDWRR